MRFYLYHQNNSGGSWRKPAQAVWVEAETPENADVVALEHGIYFDGVQNGYDCECCGDRWQAASAYASELVPAMYDDVVTGGVLESQYPIESGLIIYADGRTETVVGKKKARVV